MSLLRWRPALAGSEVTFVLSSDMYRSGMGGMDRDFAHNDMPMNRGFGDSFGMSESSSRDQPAFSHR